jgi:hypothetical protein
MAVDLGKSAQVDKVAKELDVQSDRINQVMDSGGYTETNMW